MKVGGFLNQLQQYQSNRAELQRTQDYQAEFAKPGMDPNDPEEQQKLISINPTLATQQGITPASIYEKQQVRAVQRLTSLQQAVQIWDKTYSSALSGGLGSKEKAPEGALAPESIDQSVAASAVPESKAREAANDQYQATRFQLGKQYGDDFVNRALPPVMDLNSAGRLTRLISGDPDSGLPGLLEAHKQPMQVTLTKPDGTHEVVTEAHLPFGSGPGSWGAYLAAHSGEKPVLTKLGETIPEVYSRPGGATAPMVSSRGEIKENPIASATNRMAEEFQKHPVIAGFTDLQQQAIDAKNALQLGTRAGDWTGLVKAAKAHTPGQAFTEGTALSAQQAQGLPPSLVQAWNFIQSGEGGKLTPVMRKELTEGVRMLVRGAQPGAEYQRQQYAERATGQGLDAKTVTSGYQNRNEELGQDRKGAYENQPDLEPAKGGKGAAASGVGSEDPRGFQTVPYKKANYPLVASDTESFAKDWAKVRPGESVVRMGTDGQYHIITKAGSRAGSK